MTEARIFEDLKRDHDSHRELLGKLSDAEEERLADTFEKRKPAELEWAEAEGAGDTRK